MYIFTYIYTYVYTHLIQLVRARLRLPVVESGCILHPNFRNEHIFVQMPVAHTPLHCRIAMVRMSLEGVRTHSSVREQMYSKKKTFFSKRTHSSVREHFLQ